MANRRPKSRKSSTNRDKGVVVRLTDTERRLLKAQCALDGVSMSEQILNLIHDFLGIKEETAQNSRPTSRNVQTRGNATILGYPITYVLRWMGANDYSTKQGKRVAKQLAVGEYQETTVSTAMSHGRRGVRHVPDLSKGDVNKIRNAARD